MTVVLYDTTLRDGAQSEGIAYSLEDKIKIARKLDELGIHYIEGGWPFSNPKDAGFFEHFRRERLDTAKLVAFGSTKKAGTKVANDGNLKSLLDAGTEAITLFGKSSPLHVEKVLRTTLEENLDMITESVSYMTEHGREVVYDAEHFFDAYKLSSEYAMDTLLAAERGGASCLVLCDTNGGMLPSEVGEVVDTVKSRTGLPVGIHAHNDCGLAVANSVAAVQSGAVHVQGTFNGYGERCGNADLANLIPLIQYKLGVHCLDPEKVRSLTQVSRYVNEISNVKHNGSQPFVGSRAFAHKGGVHIDAMKKDARSYEHMDPALVGNKRRFLVSELAGKSQICSSMKENGFDVDKNSPEVKEVFGRLQTLEAQGYQFEGADASFKLLVDKSMGNHRDHFELMGSRIVVEVADDGPASAEASIRINVKGAVEHTASMGDGPVNALDKALRKALEPYYPALKNMHLADYKVRVLNESEGTGAKVRVLVLCQDKDESWGTVGVSENIIKASWEALLDSIEYKLCKEYPEVGS